MPVPHFEVPALDSARQGALGAATRTVYLGAILPPPTREPTVMLERFLTHLGAPPPDACDYSPAAVRSVREVYGNSRQGDCVIASGLHGLGVWSGNDTDSGGVVVGTESEALSEYHRIGGPGDNGLDIDVALNDFVHTGLLCGGKRWQIDGFAGFGASKEMAQVACKVLGGFRIGFNVPREWMNRVVEGFVWNTPARYQFVGGHDVRIVGYDKTGVKVSTWGLLGTMSWESFLDARIVTTRRVELAPLWYNNDQLAPSGFKVDQLRGALALVKAGVVPAWQPDPVPPDPPRPPDPPQPPVVVDGTVVFNGTGGYQVVLRFVNGKIVGGDIPGFRLLPVAPTEG